MWRTQRGKGSSCHSCFTPVRYTMWGLLVTIANGGWNMVRWLWTRIQAAIYGMAPHDIHKEEEFEECAISRKNHGYMCYCYELLAWSFGRRRPARTALHKWRGSAEEQSYRVGSARLCSCKEDVLETDGLQVWCCEAQWLFHVSTL
jgi:hypothetical protein